MVWQAKSSMKRATKGNQSHIKPVSSSQSSLVHDRPDPALIQIPKDFFPHGRWASNALWFKITARELIKINTGGRGGSLRVGKKGTSFKFLAPSQIIDQHVHTWEEYSSIQSRLLQWLISAKIFRDQGGKAIEELKKPFIQNIKGKDRLVIPPGQALIEALTKAGQPDVPQYKQDTPLRYTNSGRRSYTLTFILADARGGVEIGAAVKLLQKYAAPKSEGLIGIEFPHIFRVETIPFGLITMDFAVLENVLVTWMEPYIKGLPSRCELTLQFKDMSPLFKETIEKGSIINVNPLPEVVQEQVNETNRLQRATDNWLRTQAGRRTQPEKGDPYTSSLPGRLT